MKVQLGVNATIFYDGKNKVLLEQVVEVEESREINVALANGHLVKVEEVAEEAKAETKTKAKKEEKEG